MQTTFSARSTQDLPLNGRNPLQLVVLTPGARLTDIGTQGNQQENTGVTTNGLRSIDNNYELDGTQYLDRFFDAAPILPNPDALQEFTVKASNYGASESGGSATVQLSTKSGSNDWHGTAFEYLRNDRFDARDFFAATATPFKRNQFGGTFGSRLSKTRRSSLRRTRGRGSAAAPTRPSRLFRIRRCAAEISPISLPGRVLIDPVRRAPFPGNVIPSNRFDPLSLKLLEIVPLPNVSNLQVAQTPNTSTADDQWVIRVDHSLSAKDRLTFRYSFDEFDYNRLTSAFASIFARNFFRNQNVLASDAHTFSPTFSSWPRLGGRGWRARRFRPSL